MRNAVDRLLVAIGTDQKEYLAHGEKVTREVLGKSLAFNRELEKNTIIKKEDIRIISPGHGFPPSESANIVGKKLIMNIKENEIIRDAHLDINTVEHTWDKGLIDTVPFYLGVPVRFHDLKGVEDEIEPNFYEFHLSYSDVHYDIGTLGTYNDSSFTVHAPDIFENDFLVDFISSDRSIVEQTVKHYQNVRAITLKLLARFPGNTGKARIIASVGGADIDRFLTEPDKQLAYEKIASELKKLEHPDIEWLPQTLMPFPWYFGGQQYTSLFTLPEEIVTFCENTGLSICFDTSHSKIAANIYKLDFQEYMEKLLPITKHIHLVDAIGHDVEGVQLGEGEIDFAELLGNIMKLCPDAWLLPEIFQGHKLKFKGFKEAIVYLSDLVNKSDCDE